MDIWDSRAQVPAGTVVRVIHMHGAPPPNTMGHAHIEDADTGKFAGLVLTNSLVPLGAGRNRRSNPMRFYSLIHGPSSRRRNPRRRSPRRRGPGSHRHWGTVATHRRRVNPRRRGQTRAQRAASMRNLRKARAALRGGSRRRVTSRRRSYSAPRRRSHRLTPSQRRAALLNLKRARAAKVRYGMARRTGNPKRRGGSRRRRSSRRSNGRFFW
jgi:hypothetical protein